jgi:hypothetical protein
MLARLSQTTDALTQDQFVNVTSTWTHRTDVRDAQLDNCQPMEVHASELIQIATERTKFNCNKTNASPAHHVMLVKLSKATDVLDQDQFANATSSWMHKTFARDAQQDNCQVTEEEEHV